MSTQTHDRQPAIVPPDDTTRIKECGGEQEMLADWIRDPWPASASDRPRTEE